jgi:hypothetical protein
MDEDPTIPDQESTQPFANAGDAADQDGGEPGRWLFASLPLAAIAIGVIVGATIALAGDGATSKQPTTSTSGAQLVSASTSVPAPAPVVTNPPPETLPPTPVAATVPVTAPSTTKATAPAPPSTQVIVTTPATAAHPTATTTSP